MSIILSWVIPIIVLSGMAVVVYYQYGEQMTKYNEKQKKYPPTIE